MTTHYTTDFFGQLKEGARRSAVEIVPLVVELVQPKSVIDVGCGSGEWLSVFRAHGVTDLLGVDGDYVDRAILETSKEEFLAADLRQPLNLPRQFDLVVSLEVAEHLSPESAASFVDSLVALGPVVLFSAAIPQQGGTDHQNEQWPDYWVQHFEDHQFVVIDALRPRIWQNPYVEFWYAQNILMFAERTMAEALPLLRAARAATRPSQLCLVHPDLFLAVAAERDAYAATTPTVSADLPESSIASHVAYTAACHTESDPAVAADTKLSSGGEIETLRELVRLQEASLAAAYNALSLEQDRDRQLSEEVERLGQRVAGLLNSYSWRVTTPVRALSRILRILASVATSKSRSS